MSRPRVLVALRGSRTCSLRGRQYLASAARNDGHLTPVRHDVTAGVLPALLVPRALFVGVVFLDESARR